MAGKTKAKTTAAKAKYIRINCTATDFLPLGSLKPFQGKFKILPDLERAKLKAQLLKQGLCEPIMVWKDGGKRFIVDGHQRQEVLKELIADGYAMDHPDGIETVPVNYANADNKDDAMRILLTLAGTYGRLNRKHLAKFQQSYGITAQEMDQLSFPELDLAPIEEVGKAKNVSFQAGGKPKLVKCPECEHVFDAKTNKHKGEVPNGSEEEPEQG